MQYHPLKQSGVGLWPMTHVDYGVTKSMSTPPPKFSKKRIERKATDVLLPAATNDMFVIGSEVVSSSFSR